MREARDPIQGGGAYVDDRPIERVDRVIGLDDLHDGGVLLRKGKKQYHRIVAA